MKFTILSRKRMELLNISITYARENGETRRNGISYKKPLPIKPDVWNPFKTSLEHKRHSGKIYRQACGEFETKGKPRFHPDAYDL